MFMAFMPAIECCDAAIALVEIAVSVTSRAAFGKRALHSVAHSSGVTFAKHQRSVPEAGEVKIQASIVAAAKQPIRKVIFRKPLAARVVCVAPIALVCCQNGIEVSGHLRAGPILCADDFARDAPLPVDDVSLRIHARAVVQSNLRKALSLDGVAICRENHPVILQELLVGAGIRVRADSKHHPAEWSDALL